MDWTDAWRDAFRTELRAEAITFADHGWPVVPGSYPRGDRWINIPSYAFSGDSIDLADIEVATRSATSHRSLA